MKAWLKGGLIYSVLYLLSELIVYLISFIGNFIKIMNGIIVFQKIVFFPKNFIQFFVVNSNVTIIIGGGGLQIFANVIFLFLIGALIGFIVSKIKSKKQTTQPQYLNNTSPMNK